jgi:hypothetical protein
VSNKELLQSLPPPPEAIKYYCQGTLLFRTTLVAAHATVLRHGSRAALWYQECLDRKENSGCEASL